MTLRSGFGVTHFCEQRGLGIWECPQGVHLPGVSAIVLSGQPICTGLKKDSVSAIPESPHSTRLFLTLSWTPPTTSLLPTRRPCLL